LPASTRLRRCASACSALVLGAVFLSGCATAPSNDRYVAPVGLNTATLVIKNASSYPVSITVYEDGAKCTRGTRPFTEGAAGGQPGRMNVAEATTIAVPAAQEFAVAFQADGIMRDLKPHRCAMVGSFVPRAGTTYTARFAVKGATCSLGILRIPTAAESKELEVPELSFRLKKPVGSGCEDDFGRGLLTSPLDQPDPKHWTR